MSEPRLPAFDPADIAESNATSYPEKFRALNSQRWNRRLGDHVGLTNFGVNLTRVVPGGQSSARHAHSKQDEFIWVVSGEVVLETNEARKPCGRASAPALQRAPMALMGSVIEKMSAIGVARSQP